MAGEIIYCYLSRIKTLRELRIVVYCSTQLFVMHKKRECRNTPLKIKQFYYYCYLLDRNTVLRETVNLMVLIYFL